MLKRILLSAMLILSLAACGSGYTKEEIEKKGREFGQAAATYAQQQPERFAQFADEMQKELASIKQNDLDALAKFYDKWTAKFK